MAIQTLEIRGCTTRWCDFPLLAVYFAVAGFAKLSHLLWVVSFPDPSRRNREEVWQHIIHCCVHAHCTVRANQITEFKYVMLIDNVLTKQWCPDKALDVARVRVDYEKLLPQQRNLRQ